MKRLLFISLILIFFFFIKAEEKSEKSEQTEQSDVLVLDDKTFEEGIKKHEFILVEFYAPWCGHCKALAPEYEKAATKLKDKIPLAKVDCDANRETAEKYEIQGFPTLKLFKNGKFFKDFEAGRTAESIVNWLKKKTGPPAETLKTNEDIEKFIKDNENSAVIGYFKSKDDEAYKQFLKVVEGEKTFEDFPAGEFFDEKLEAPYAKIFREFKPTEPLETKNFENLVSFIKEHGYPLIEEISAKNFQRFVDAGVPLAVLFLDYDKTEEKEQTLKLIESIAEKFKGKFSFSFSNGKDYKDQLEAMGGSGNKLPAIAAMDLEKRQNFPYEGEFVKEGIEQWVSGIIDGSIKPFYRSDPIPEKNDEPVYVVVGKTYEEIVLDKTKDVVLEFYAPWCGHCKQLAPKYEKLAKKFQGKVKNLLIAKIDATTNDTPYPIEGFPTVVFFPGTNKDKPIPYEGDRTVEDLYRFIKDHATVSKEEMDKLEGEKEKEKEKEEEKKEKPKDEL